DGRRAGHGRQVVAGRRVGQHRLDQGPQQGVPGGRGGGGGELRLAARALEEDDQFARDVAGRVRAVVVLDEGQAQVDARADAGGGDEAPVPDVDRVRFDTHPRVAPGEGPGVPPV